MNKIAIFASGEGTTAEAFILSSAKGNINSSVGLVISNNSEAGVFERIVKLNKKYDLNIKSTLINGKTHPPKTNEIVNRGYQTRAEEKIIFDTLISQGFDLVVLMGYMKHMGPSLVKQFGWRNEYSNSFQAMMLNTHPGLLPETKGLYGSLIQAHVLNKKLPFAGQTLHVVAEKYDDGPIVAEHKVRVAKDDTPESLFEKIRTVEKQYLPKDIDNFIKNRQNYLIGKDSS